MMIWKNYAEPKEGGNLNYGHFTKDSIVKIK